MDLPEMLGFQLRMVMEWSGVDTYYWLVRRIHQGALESKLMGIIKGV
jgi:hypothetical protein